MTHSILGSSLTQIINEEIPIGLLKFFKLFWADPQFTEYYHQIRGDSEITVGSWTTSSEFGSIREVQFRAALNQPIGPSSARCEETQRYHLSKTKLTIETAIVTYDIPFGDSFRVEGKWEATAGSTANSVRLTVSVGVHFLKKTWFKGKIETGSIKENRDSFGQWVALCKQEIIKKSMEKDDSLQHKTDLTKSTGDSLNYPKVVPVVLPTNRKKSLFELYHLKNHPKLQPLLMWIGLAIFLILFLIGYISLLGLIIVILLVFVGQMDQRIQSLESNIHTLNSTMKSLETQIVKSTHYKKEE